jgi:hypothetical protein
MAAENVVISMGPARRRRQAARNPEQLHTIAVVSRLCGLPGPVVMQLVERTWTDRGWMYTDQQLHSSLEIAAELRRRNASRPPAILHDPIDTVMCDNCGTVVTVDGAPAAGWLAAAEPDASPGGDPLGRDYCPQCVAPCPVCTGQPGTRSCQVCRGAGAVPRRL